MIKPTLVLFFVTASITLTGQATFSFQSDTQPVLKGILIGYDKSKDANLKITASLVALESRYKTKKDIPINKDGSFELILDRKVANRQIWLSIGDYYFGQLLITKELKLTIQLDKLKKSRKRYFSNKHIEFSGSDGALTDYVNRFETYRQSHRKDPYKRMNKAHFDKELSNAEKVIITRTQHNLLLQMIDKFAVKNPSTYAWVLRNEVNSQFYQRIMAIYNIDEIPPELFSEILHHQPKFISNSGRSFFSFLAFYLQYYQPDQAWFKLYKASILPTITKPNEQQRMLNFLDLYQSKINGNPYNEVQFRSARLYFIKKYRSIIDAFALQGFANRLKHLSFPAEKASIIIYFGSKEDIWAQKRYIQQVLPSIESDWIRDFMQQDWAQSKLTIDRINDELTTINVSGQNKALGTPKGTLENGTELYLAKQKQLTDLIADIRSQYPGKALIFDIWATWCGPCIMDMKNKKTASNKKKLQALGVEVIYLCHNNGSREKTWIKKVAELDMESAKHIYLNDALSSEIMDYFKLGAFPSYVFLNADGKYIPSVVHRISIIDFEKVKKNIR